MQCSCFSHFFGVSFCELRYSIEHHCHLVSGMFGEPDEPVCQLAQSVNLVTMVMNLFKMHSVFIVMSGCCCFFDRTF